MIWGSFCIYNRDRGREVQYALAPDQTLVTDRRFGQILDCLAW